LILGFWVPVLGALLKLLHLSESHFIVLARGAEIPKKV